MEADGLFVYGTLREGGSNHPWLARTHPEGHCRAFVPGRLFQLPSETYPALVAAPEPVAPPPGPGWVVGEFVGYEGEAELASALQDLDALEDVEGGLYARVPLPCVLDSGLHFTAWTYVFPEDRLPRLEREALELPEGDWEAYLR